MPLVSMRRSIRLSCLTDSSVASAVRSADRDAPASPWLAEALNVPVAGGTPLRHVWPAYLQFFPLDANANAMGLSSSNYAKLVIGN